MKLRHTIVYGIGLDVRKGIGISQAGPLHESMRGSLNLATGAEDARKSAPTHNGIRAVFASGIQPVLAGTAIGVLFAAMLSIALEIPPYLTLEFTSDIYWTPDFVREANSG